MALTSNILFSPNIFSLLALLSVLCGAVVWWIVRKKEHRIWLPTIRILPKEQKFLPKLVVKAPPLVLFLCFLGLCLTFLFLSTQPKSEVFKPFDPDQSKYLIFADLSPSISASITLEDLKSTVKNTCSLLASGGKVYFASSIEKDPLIISSCDELPLSDKFQFHSAGLRLGEAIKAVMQKHQDFDQMYIISDQNQHTWSGFNWKYINSDVEIFLVNTQNKKYGNVYINSAKILNQMHPTNQDKITEWDVEIVRTDDDIDTSGIFQVYDQDQLVKEQQFNFPPGKRRITTRIEWTPPNSHSLLTEISERFVEFRLKTNLQSENTNRISLDDSLKASYQTNKQVISLIAENSGEQILEDPTGPLQTSLETLGFIVEKRDFMKDIGEKKSHALEIYAGGLGTTAEQFCPQFLYDSKSKKTEDKEYTTQKAWLIPVNDDIDFFEMCRCLNRLFPENKRFNLEACQHVHTRKDWVTLLPSVGGKQLGGDVGSSSDAFGFFFKFFGENDLEQKKPQLDLLVLTVSFVAKKIGGFSIAKIPLVIKDLLTWHGLYTRNESVQKDSWPRINDIAEELWNKSNYIQLALASNVPLGESEFSPIDLSELPPQFNPLKVTSHRSAPVKRDTDDPLPWIKGAILALMGITICEIFAWVFSYISQLKQRRKKTASLVIILLGMALGGKESEAKVDFGVIGSTSSPLSTQLLAREVAGRTSIELTIKPQQFGKFQLNAFELPWLWAVKLEEILDRDGRLPRDAVVWIKRGGFLIIETNLPTKHLNELTSHLGTLNGETNKQVVGWLPLPPDHELMRSFYLLDALPDCHGEIWRGLQFDGRLAVLAIPYGFLDSMRDQGIKPVCGRPIDQERAVRIFVNLIMVALATDYKKDQIHLPEILKRLR